jgi:ribonuclease P/MRP protein subunit RPP40
MSGVPQGSVLGPLLFCMVTNDLSPVCKNSSIVQYADDIILMHFLRDTSDDHIDAEWNNLTKWANSLFLDINLAKCRLMDIITKKSMSLPSIRIADNQCLDPVSDIKYLGCIISSDMKWKKHIDSTIKKASQRIYLIVNLRRADCPAFVIFQAYCAYIRSVLLYAFPAFSNIPAYLMKELQKIEKRIFKIIGCSSNDFPSLLSVGDKMGSNLFQAVVSEPDHPLRCFFSIRDVKGLRSKSVLKRPKARTKRFYHSFIKYCDR